MGKCLSVPHRPDSMHVE
jgi:MFS family permease